MARVASKIGSLERSAHQIYLDSHGFIHMIYVGDLDKTSGLDLLNYARVLANELVKQNKKVNVISDIRKLGNHTLAARKTGVQARETLPFNKMAIILPKNESINTKVSRQLTKSSSRQEAIAYFHSDAVAIRWLQS